VERALEGRPHQVLFFPGGEPRKKMAEVEALAEQMIAYGGDRSSVVVAFGGGIVTDVAGFLAAVFLRGIPVIQIPTTLLAQVDAAVGGKTGVNLVSGKNLVGSFHQPLVVLIDPDVLKTLPEREYRAGLYEIIKCGVIRDAELFRVLSEGADRVFAQEPATVDRIIADAVRIKAEVVTADEREGDLRRILNFGHTVGHALEADTQYQRFLHGEAVAFGMHAATALAERVVELPPPDAARIHAVIRKYGPIPALTGITASSLFARLAADKKTVQGKVHFVLPVKIGDVKIVTGVDDRAVMEAIEVALAS
jgi:3-dehydroquinate synthase